MIFFVLLTVLLIVLLIIFFKKPNYIYDLSHNRKCNFFEIYDIENLKKSLKKCPNKILIDDWLPEWVNIEMFPDKGWGLVTKKAFKKNEIVYKAPILLYPEGEIEVVSRTLGSKKIVKEIHLGDLEQKYGLFTCYDSFLNHSNNPSAYHDVLFAVEDNHIYIMLRACRNIDVDTELTINYLYLNKYIYYIQSYIKGLTTYL
jgi:hypothetical protein